MIVLWASSRADYKYPLDMDETGIFAEIQGLCLCTLDTDLDIQKNVCRNEG